MLQKIHNQNFRSLKEVSLHLQDVNLLIGTNNSGKSNFLKVFEFFSQILHQKTLSEKEFLSIYPRAKKELSSLEKDGFPIKLRIEAEYILS